MIEKALKINDLNNQIKGDRKNERDCQDNGHEEMEAKLYRQIGQLKVELERLKKKSQILG